MTPNDPEIDLTAAEWAVRLHARELTAEEQAQLDQWQGADARHRGALLRARAAWVNLDRLAALAGRAESPAIERDPPHASQAGLWTRRRMVGAGLVGFVGAGASLWWLDRHDPIYVSKLGEIRHVTLSDGSRMVLNTDTEATVRFDQVRREIELASGEGLFQVVKDAKRPFIVKTGSISVRAVGTVFAVRTAGGRVDVTVTEGVVELLDGNGSDARVLRRIAANQRASVMQTRQVEIQSVPNAEVQRQLAWRDGMVDFAGEPLIKAVAEINRHNRRQIIVDDAALASRPVVGLFRATDPENFAVTVAAALSAHSIQTDDAIHLRLDSSP